MTVLAVAAAAAGYLARSELARRRHRACPDACHQARLAGPDERWLYGGLWKIIAAADPGDRPWNLTVAWRDREGGDVLAAIDVGDPEPDRVVMTEVEIGGQQAYQFTPLDVPDDARGAEEI